jgi:hypothetical protein
MVLGTASRRHTAGFTPLSSTRSWQVGLRGPGAGLCREFKKLCSHAIDSRIRSTSPATPGFLSGRQRHGHDHSAPEVLCHCLGQQLIDAVDRVLSTFDGFYSHCASLCTQTFIEQPNRLPYETSAPIPEYFLPRILRKNPMPVNTLS